jgi:hypothetical protein
MATTRTSIVNQKFEVNLSDLHMFHRALMAAHSHFEMEDMQRALLNMQDQFQESPITTELKDARLRVAGLVAEAMANEYLGEDLSYDKHADLELSRFEDDGGPSE